MRRRIVVKLGTSLLTRENGVLDREIIKRIVEELVTIQRKGNEIILVSSGAISAGMGKLGFKRRPKTIPDLQASAAVGQSRLMHCYEEEFKKRGALTAQVLLTREDMENRTRYLNARNTLLTLLRHRVIPIVNENDTVSVDEIRFGDNDILSALVSIKLEADLLILLTDVDGLYKTRPVLKRDSELIRRVDAITPEIESFAGQPGDSCRGTGGMYSKIQAAKISTSSGVSTVIANGKRKGILEDILEGKQAGTLFTPRPASLSGKKRWLAFGARVRGKIMIDPGAEEAILKKGKSLLPSGILKVEGNFKPGDVVSLISQDHAEIARGICSYSSEDLEKIRGHHTREIIGLLGYKDYDEVIHRNNLAIIQ